MTGLHSALTEYLRVRRSMGFQLCDVERQLRKFISFLAKRGQSHVTVKMVLAWVGEMDIASATKARRVDMVRHFAQYRSVADPNNEVPPHGLFPRRYRRKKPYIYSDDEIVRLINATRQIRSAAGFRAKTFSTLLGLLTVAGIRVGECLALNRNNVDLEEGVLTIEGTKFHKSRLIPLHPSAQKRLRQYECWRDRIFPRPVTPSFFVSNLGTRLLKANVRSVFIQLSCQIGLRKPSDRHGPRLHDLRHRFAVKTLLDWYRSGVDVEQHIAELATYLGHASVSSTYWYLSSTPELLRLVAMRLDHPNKENSHASDLRLSWFARRIFHRPPYASGPG